MAGTGNRTGTGRLSALLASLSRLCFDLSLLPEPGRIMRWI